MRWAWRARDIPLPPIGALTPDGALHWGDALPWVDGVVYLGKDPRAPNLFLPTTLEPDVPVDLFQRAVLRLAGPGVYVVVRDEVIAI